MKGRNVRRQKEKGGGKGDMNEVRFREKKPESLSVKTSLLTLRCLHVGEENKGQKRRRREG